MLWKNIKIWGLMFFHILEDTVLTNRLDHIRFQFLGSQPGMTGNYVYETIKFVPFMTFSEMSNVYGTIFLPNDIVMRTFYEMYALGVPIFLPDRSWMFRIQRIAPWGSMAYGVPSDSVDGDAPWFNSINVDPEKLFKWYEYSDFQQFPHLNHFNSVIELLQGLHQATDLQWRDGKVSKMREFHRKLAFDALSRYTISLEKIF